MKALKPDAIVNIGNTGKAVIFIGRNKGKTLMFRAELDALPVSSAVTAKHKSAASGISHACGHDGHMAILAGLAKRIAASRPGAGRVILLFQPAEETGQGAFELLNDPLFKSLEPDCLFALHNIPGEEKNTVLLKSGHFAAASQGLIINLIGKTSHAAEPENGSSPTMAVASLITELNKISENKDLYRDLAFLTIIHIRVGEVAFGTSPGNAQMMLTMRAVRNEDIDTMTKLVEEKIKSTAKAHKLGFTLEYTEVFPAMVNDMDCLLLAEKAARNSGLDIKHLSGPFKWSEDFAYFSQKYKACLVGLGAGKEQAQLHNPDYDFPDEILDAGITLFCNIYKEYNLNDE